MADEIFGNESGNVADDAAKQGLDAEGAGNNADDAAGENNGTNTGDDGKEKNLDSEVYGSPETYDYAEVKMPDGMELDKDMLDKFNPLAKKYNLSNKSANELMNLAVEMQQKNMAKFGDLAKQLQENEKNSYEKLLNTDEELSKKTDAEYSQYLSVANLGVKKFATDGFKKLLKEKGLDKHPEFIKTFHEMGKLCQSDTPPNVQNPAGKKLDAADILYGTRSE